MHRLADEDWVQRTRIVVIGDFRGLDLSAHSSQERMSRVFRGVSSYGEQAEIRLVDWRSGCNKLECARQDVAVVLGCREHKIEHPDQSQRDRWLGVLEHRFRHFVVIG